MRRLSGLWRSINKSSVLAPLAVAGVLGLAGLGIRELGAWREGGTNPVDEISMRVIDLGLTDAGITFAADDPIPVDDLGRPACPRGSGCRLPEDDSQSVRTWLRELGAYDVRQSHRRLILENRGSRPVEIIDGRAVVRERSGSAPASTVTFAAAGASDAIGLLFNLDTDPAAALDGSSGAPADEAPRYFDRKFITLRPGERQPVDIVGTTSSDNVTWILELDVISEDEARTVTAPGVHRTVGEATSERASEQWLWQDGTFEPQSGPLEVSGR